MLELLSESKGALRPDNSRTEQTFWAAPDAELERRWHAVRTAMEREGLDALLIHNHVDAQGGYVKYFCDMPASGGYPLSIIFPREEPMTLVVHGPNGASRELPEGNPMFHGVERVLSTWSFQTAAFTSRYDAEQILVGLKPYARGRIGLLGLAQTPHDLLAHVKEQMASARFIDASDVVDPIKAIRSPYELEAVQRTVELQRAAFEAALDAIEPGVREWDVASAALRVARDGGSEHGPVMVGSAPAGRPAQFKPRRQQTRVLQPGDRLTILIEPTGPDDMYGELGRTITIGPADDALLAEHEFTVKAWHHCASRLRPGAIASEVAANYNSFLADAGRPIEERIHCHGQGYDIVERPFIRADDQMELQENMLIALHPAYHFEGNALWVCDNLLIGPDGPSVPLHGIEQKVFEV